MIPRLPLIGKRFAAGTTEKGRYTEGSDSAINFTASVQPLRPNELAALPEGKRENAQFKLFTDFVLKTIDAINKTSADRVEIDSEFYEVISVEKWGNNIIPYYKAVVGLIG